MLPRSLLFSLAGLAGPALAASNRTETVDGCAALKSTGLTTLGGDTYYKPSEAAACLKSVPFDLDLRDHIIEVVSKTWNLEIYEYNQINWPAPLAQHTDVRAELKRMSGQSYGSDYEFNKDLTDTIRSLNDGHHAWISCYPSAFQTLQTLALVSLAKNSSDANSTDTAIFVVPDAAELTKAQGIDRIYKDVYGIDAADFAGKEVVKIDGMDPWTYIDQIVNTETGSYQDLGTRRSAALASYASSGSDFGTTWNRDIGSIGNQAFPVRDTITYEVVISEGQTKTVTVPYLSRVLFKESTAKAFFKENCLVADAKSKDSSSTRRSSSLDSIAPRSLALRADDKGAESQCPPASLQPTFTVANSPVDSSAYIGGRWNQFFVLPGNEQGKVGVIYITTFIPDAKCVEDFVREVGEGVQNFTRLGVQRVIIDTTDDGGGYISLSALWQRILSGPSFEKKLGFEGVFRVADLWKLYRGSSTGPSSFLNTQGKPFKSDLDLYKNKGSDLAINGHDLPVTDVLRDDFSTDVEVYIKQLPGDWSKPIWSADSLLIFSNGGTCGSACSLLTNFLNINLNVQTHLVVARPDQPTEYSSFAAQAFTLTDLYTQLDQVGLNATDPSVPPPLQVQANLGIAIRGFYTPGTTDWLQYTSIPADKTFALTAEMYMDPLKMYAKAAQTKWGGTLPAAEDQQTVEKTGMLGMSQSTTIKAAVGVGAAGVIGAAGFAFFLIRRRSSRAKRGAYVEVQDNIAPLGTFELPSRDRGRFN